LACPRSATPRTLFPIADPGRQASERDREYRDNKGRRLGLIADSGHWVMEEQPEQTTAAIVKFILAQ
jgi:pimeloyl-ACP methyl ester carboxylesterase